MVKDAKMKDETKEDEKAEEKEEEKKDENPPLPPLVAAARRLERLLGGPDDRVADFYTNPVKVVRRWLGTSSGAAGSATAENIQNAAADLLDPAGPCSVGRALLVPADRPIAMEEEGDEEKKPSITYMTQASAREVECWLISLAVRLLWKEGKHTEAFELSQKGIEICTAHVEEASRRVTATGSASSLFPLLARLFRYRSLTAEILHSSGIEGGLRVGMAKALVKASLRRDVDTQATLLNCMLRDLLKHSQGKFQWVAPDSLVADATHGLSPFSTYVLLQLNKRTSCSPTQPFQS
jgi:hypothetical protein